jgi:hypothetical protein
MHPGDSRLGMEIKLETEVSGASGNAGLDNL